MKKQQVILGVAIVTTAVAVAALALWLQRPAAGTPPAITAEAADGGAEHRWFRHEDEALAAAKSRGVPILVDFYADWCEPCLQMEKYVFSTEEFRAKAKDWVLFRVDATNESNEVGSLLQKYQVSGLPSLRFRKPDGSALPQFDVDGALEFPQLSALMDEVRETATR